MFNGRENLSRTGAPKNKVSVNVKLTGIRNDTPQKQQFVRGGPLLKHPTGHGL